MNQQRSKLTKPTVFVSSTCYDLKQVREDMRRFIENDLGYEAMLSEQDVFPINSELSAIENCIQTVERRADLFVLIIGGRYGQLVENTEKSITNLEYDTAREKGIPTYIFVEQRIIDILSVWEKNRTGDFSDVVDSNKVFEFVSQLSSNGKNWIFKFQNAQDIIEKLKSQFAFLLNDSLDLRRRFASQNISDKVWNYPGRIFQLVMEKPNGWEYWLFIEAMDYNLQKQQDLRYDLKYRIYLKENVLIKEPQKIIDLCQIKINELKNRVDSLKLLMNQGIQEALGEPGSPGNPEHILYITERIAGIYRAIGEWSLDFKKYEVPDKFERLFALMSRWGNTPLQGIEAFVPMAREKLRSVLIENSTDSITLTMTIDLEEELTEEINHEFNNLALLKKNHDW